MKIGDTLYWFDGNTRVYDQPGFGGRAVYAKHFVPLKIVGENNVSWILERDWKVNKKTGKGEARSYSYGGRGFFTAEGMADDIWQHEHRHKILREVERAPLDQIKKIAAIIGYDAQ
jgi:hypothetical protein